MQIRESNQEIKIYFEKWLRFIFFLTLKSKKENKNKYTKSKQHPSDSYLQYYTSRKYQIK